MKFKSKKERIIFTAIISMLAFMLINPPVSYAETNGKGNMIFDFDNDGYWKPGDTITRNFKITNTWETECYLSALYFKDCNIEDEKGYQPFDVELRVIGKDSKDLIFKGNISDLDDTRISLNDKRELKYNDDVDFEMTLSFEPQAGNEFQSKEFKYIIYPAVYKLLTDNTDALSPLKTGDSMAAVCSALVIISLMSLIVYFRRRRAY